MESQPQNPEFRNNPETLFMYQYCLFSGKSLNLFKKLKQCTVGIISN